MKPITLMKKTEEDTKSGDIFHAHRLEELILSKRPYYPNRSTVSMKSLLKYQRHSSQKSESISQIWNNERSREKKEQNWSHHHTFLPTYHKPVVTKTVQLS
jgi:hypothetical protein